MIVAPTAEVNGEVVGRDLLSNMSWTFEEMAGYASCGTVIASQSPPPLKPGDTVTLTVEGIGRTENVVVPGRTPIITLPAARKRPRTRP